MIRRLLPICDITAARFRFRSSHRDQFAKLLVVVYVAGYSTVPGDLDLACRMIVAQLFGRADHGADGIAEERLGEYTVKWDAATLPATAKQILAKYRELPVRSAL